MLAKASCKSISVFNGNADMDLGIENIGYIRVPRFRQNLTESGHSDICAKQNPQPLTAGFASNLVCGSEFVTDADHDIVHFSINAQVGKVSEIVTGVLNAAKDVFGDRHIQTCTVNDAPIALRQGSDG